MSDMTKTPPSSDVYPIIATLYISKHFNKRQTDYM